MQQSSYFFRLQFLPSLSVQLCACEGCKETLSSVSLPHFVVLAERGVRHVGARPWPLGGME